MNDCMMFPDDWREFLKSYSFKDTEELYTNGSELIPVFRVEQLIEHLLKEQEPRVLTLEEVANQLKEPAFLETKSRQSYTGWVLVYDVQKGMGITGVRMGLTQPGHITSWYPIDLYDIKWRCWSAKPTDEQMDGTPWEK